MKKTPLKTRPPVGAEEVERVTLSLDRDDKLALARIAEEKRVSVAWVIRDAITKYLDEGKKAATGESGV